MRDADDDQRPGDELGRRCSGQRGQHGDGHADHAEHVAAPRGLRARQPAQRQDEQHARDEIEQRDEIGLMVTLCAASALRLLFLLVHAEHALGDEEAAENVHRRHDQRHETERLRQLGPARRRPAPTPTASSAPTTITEEMALVTDISGVCRAGVTLHTT